MKKILLLAVACIMTFSWTATAQKPDSPINPDPNVRIGKLENGITYYLRANNKPEKRIEFRLAVNAGSNQENDDQQGLAHFVEHMGFNGIEGYPGNDLVGELQKIGVAFGADINAYTSFDETVYMVQLPSDDDKYLTMGLDILYGWAHGMTFDDEEIDAERGVITEEYRVGLGADDRMRKKWFPVVLSNSRYADRSPIGKLDIIQNFKYQTIKDFYTDWYRPDLQAVIIVGDINVDKMEQAIKNKFGSIKPLQNPREKIMYPIANNTQPLAVVATDKEAMGNQVLLIRKFPHFTMKTVADFQTTLTHQLYNIMINSRLNELEQDAQSPFLGAYTGYGNLIGAVDCYMSQAASKENRIDEAIAALLREDYRVLKHGFVQTELDRAKEELLSSYEIAANEVDKTESATFASQYIANYLHHDPIPGAKREYNLAKNLVKNIKLEDINALAKKWVSPESIVAVVLAPEKEGIKVPTEAEVLAIVKDPKLAEVEPYVDTYREQEIVEKESLTPGKITAVKDLPEVNAKEVTLNNGIKVVLKKTDFKNDEILFSAQSKGGASLYDVKDLPSVSLAADLVDRAGISELDFASLTKKMKGKTAGIIPFISTLSEGFSGSTAPKDLEFFMQYLHAFFASPRHDPSVYDLVTSEYMEQIKMLQANPMYKFFGMFMGEMTQNDPYQLSELNYTEDYIKSVNYERAFNIYKERFANPADFIFTFVGNFDEAQMNTMLETYLGSLKTTTGKENFRGDVLKDFPTTKTEKNIYAGVDDKSWVGLAYNKEYPWNLKNNMIISQIGEALQIEVLETIREKMGGVYSPILQLGTEKYPDPTYTLLVMFSCSPENTDKLSNAVIDILKTFQKNGPKKETLDKVKEQMIRGRENSIQTNRYWNSLISGCYYMEEGFEGVNNYAERVKEVTNQDIVDFLQKYFDPELYIKLYLYPESMQN